MCGILGSVGDRLPGETAFTAALDLLSHRGPDSSGITRFDSGIFGHRRLSIIDLSDCSAQPFETERSILTFNGEIYNYQRLRNELIAAGGVFRSSGDTEVVARVYEMMGVSGFDHLEGMFAFALYDKKTGETHLVRDQFGIKPLYFVEGAEHLSFASEIRPLLELEGRRGVNGKALEETCIWGFPLSQQTFFEGIQQVAPGVCATVHGSRIARANRLQGQAKERFTEDDLERVLRSSVSDHMIADVPVALALSGGLDSSVIAALAKDINPDITTFTTTFSDEEDDEVRAARIVAKHCGLRHEVLKLTIPDFEEHLAKITWHLEDPIANPNVFPTFGLSQVIQDAGFRVLLMGEGSDELFAGYPWHQAAVRPFAGNRSMFDTYRRRRGQHEYRRYFRDDASARVDRRQIEFRETFDTAAGSGRPLDRMLSFEKAYQLQFSQLLRVDKMMMAHSVEARVPFLHRRVASAALALPSRRKATVWKFGKVRDNKIALADLARRVVPQSIADRPKFGRGGTVNLWSTPLMQGFEKACTAILTSSEYAPARDYLGEWIAWDKLEGLPKKQAFTICQLVMTIHIFITGPAFGRSPDNSSGSHGRSSEPALRSVSRERQQVG